MNKSVLVIRGSARGAGYSNRLCDEAVSLLGDVDVYNFETYKESFAPCDGCNFCAASGRCVHRDLDDFFVRFCEADVIIFSSPVYNGGFSAPIKSLIDRFQVYYTRFFAEGRKQPIPKRRKAIFIAAAGSDGREAADYMARSLECAFSILNIELKKTILCNCTDTKPTYDEALAELKRSLADE